MTVPWVQVAHAFTADGTLRDIYVRPTARADWAAMLTMLTERYGPMTVTRGGEATALPTDVDDLFAPRAESSWLLGVHAAGIDLRCHCFTPDEIEWDLPPAQIDSPARFAALVDFLGALATTLGKTVVLTPENLPDISILTVTPAPDPDGAYVQYHAPRGE